jgi:hypothetical protein
LGESGVRERALGALGGSSFRERALGLALGSGSGGSGFRERALGSTIGSGSTMGSTIGGVFGLFKLPLGLPAFRFSGSIY